MVDEVTPVAGLTNVVVSAGDSVQAVPAMPNGGLITNPLSGDDQGIVIPEPLYIDPVGLCVKCEANGTVFARRPGDTWEVIPGQTTPTYVNAPTAGHKFSVVYW